MGYLDKSSITVDAILTKRGREKLASGDFTITKFALADDEIDYGLWDESHSKGTLYYGQAIENMPMVEAIPDESKVMRYKLMTLSKNIQKLPFLQLSPADATFTLTGLGSSGTITAMTSTSKSGGAQFADSSYTAIISDKSVANFNGAIDIDAGSSSAGFAVTSGVANITFYGNPSETAAKSTTITIVGNQTGITATVTLNVSKLTT